MIFLYLFMNYEFMNLYLIDILGLCLGTFLSGLN